MKRASPFFRRLRAAYLFSLVLGFALLVVGSFLDPRAYAMPLSEGAVRVDVAPFKLPITPVTAQYFDRLVSQAEADGAAALVVELDTPGGLVNSMQEMVQRTLSARVPVIVYVSPQGAMSASAGVFIVYASHIAAMAPNTTIGSSEVIISGGSDSGSNGTPETGDAAAERRKATNMLVSSIRNLAEHRGRNVQFGENAVRRSENLGAKAAVDSHVVDLVAGSVPELLDKADGRIVDLNGQKITLHTKGAAIGSLSPTFGEDLLFLVTNPSVAFILISLGTLGLTWEFINPGAVFPGVLGALFLLVGFLGLGTLPINWAGAVFLALAFVLFIADIFMPSHGVLTAGGIVALVLGGLLLVNTSAAPGIPGVSPAVVAGTASGLGLVFFFAVFKVFEARKRIPATGREGLVGRIAEARTVLAPSGMVYVSGELWNAVSTEGTVPVGASVRVVGADGLRLRVRAAEVVGAAEAEPTTAV